MRTRTPWQLAVAASAAASVLLTAGCGSDSSDDDSGGGGGGGGGGSAAVDVEAARDAIASLTQPPEDFPITEPLAQIPEPGTVVAFLDIGTPTPAVVYEQLRQAGELLNIEVRRVQTGQSPQEINAAMNSLVESRPDAVIDLAIDPALFAPQLQALQEQGAVFIPQSIVNGEQFGFDDSQVIIGAASARAAGSVLASAVLAETGGEATDLVLYNVPELAFSPLMIEGMQERIGEQCPDCAVRVVDISISEVGSTASRTIVSDLQANRDTDAFIASVDELQIGLPAAMSVAGMDIQGMGISPTAVNLEQIAAGQQAGGLASDPRMVAWMSMDQALRQMAGQEYDYSAYYTEVDPALFQVVTEDNVPADAEEGYVAFEDYQDRFAEVWGVGR